LGSQIAASEKAQEELSDACGNGQPTTAVTQALLQHADQLIQKECQTKTRKLANEISVSKESVNNITDTVGQTWRKFLRPRAQTVHKFQRKFFGMPMGILKAK